MMVQPGNFRFKACATGARLLALNADHDSPYVDKDRVTEEIAFSRKLCARHHWPVIDVTRRSIEETAAAIIDLYRNRQMAMLAE